MNPKDYSEDIDFQKFGLILKRRWLPGAVAFLAIFTLATLSAMRKTPTYEAQGKLLFQKKNTSSSLITEAGEKLGQLETLNMMNTPVDTQAQVVTSLPIVTKTIEALNLRDKKGNLIEPEAFFSGLTVKGIKGTDVLQISYKAKSAQEAADVVNKLMRLYIEDNILKNRAEAAAAREFISKELPTVQANVRQAEAALRTFKEKNNIVALEQEAVMAVDVITGIDRQLATTEAQLADTTARVAEIQQKLNMSPEKVIDLSSVNQSKVIESSLQELQRVEAQLILERTRFTATHPVIRNLEDKRDGLKAFLQGQIGQSLGTRTQLPNGNLQTSELKEKIATDLVSYQGQRLGLIKQIGALNRTKQIYRNRANLLPKLQEKSRDLERQVEAAQTSYQLLLKNYQEAQIAENQNVGNAMIIEDAIIPGKPADSKKKLFLIGGFAAGVMVYVVIAFLVDLADPTLKTAKELRHIFNYTVLGMIPSWKKRLVFPIPMRKQDETVKLPVKDAPHSIISETYRMLQANLKFLSPDRELKVIVVTSSVSKEGKSTVSANLAVAMSQLGRKVLLIDADMHHPIQHHIWNLTNAAGLSDVIVGQADVNSAVKEVMTNLDVLPSGVIPPNPLALLDSKRMASLIEDFSATYNFVIIDTPPLVLVADALTLGKMADGMLLVARPSVVDTVSASASKGFLVQSAQNVLGMVVNGIIIENEPDSYFHHAKSYNEDLTTTKATLAKKEKVSS
ncbi:polysaccharide biosynthesis tyrosine autokinase [Phormidium sp. LEGE 05292]|uniref:GumC family protein n=1 Tax=[Phormidium] sp. LEGE 05292 TaxID=767427 RepID=UPI00188277DC|nr:polysaccharide biosynthesis tyrosine autokinase [Phormidium sp. LEGE 05292]MBE9224343.1 polysaccharide biosynthesis tyrosine autokinase [Phormidium sp. LEGE 05292]